MKRPGRKQARAAAVLIAALACLLAGPAAALDDRSILWVSWVKPKAGMEREFVAGLHAHQAWRKGQGETWRWIVWRIGSGERSGTYAIGTFDRRWADFADPPVPAAAARAHWLAAVAPFVASTDVHHYTYQKTLNTLRDDQPPRKFSVTEEFELRPGREADFVAAAAKIRDAINAAGLPYFYEWYRLETGGVQPLYARVRLLWDWQELEVDDAAVEAAVTQTFGARQGAKILAQFHDAVRRETNRYAELRPDLFLIPET